MKSYWILFCGFSLIACSPKDKSPGESGQVPLVDSVKLTAPPKLPAGWIQLNKDAYSIQYPGTWEVDENGQNGIRIYILSPLNTAEPDFRLNLNLVTEDLSGQGINYDLDNYVRLATEQIKKVGEHQKILESTKLKGDAGPYQKIVYQADAKGISVQLEQHVWMVKNKAWILTCASKSGTSSALMPEAIKIMESFRIKN